MNLCSIPQKDLQTVLKSYTVTQLKLITKDYGLRLLSKLKKNDIIEAIYNSEINKRQEHNE